MRRHAGLPAGRQHVPVGYRLERLLGLEVFRSVFPVLLTDNGTEFSNPRPIERSVDGDSVRTQGFYCDPYAAWQKSNLKNNHRNLRRILTKDESMDFLTQEKVNLPLSHMNIVIRVSLGNVTAARRVAQCHRENVLEKLGIREIAPDQVRMTPELVRDSAAPSHQCSLQPPRSFNPSEKGTAQDGQENCVPKVGDYAEFNATSALERMAREKNCGIECTTCRKTHIISP